MASPNVDVERLQLALDKVLKPVEHLLISPDRLTERTRIAGGGFGTVSTAQLRPHPGSPDFQIVAVKELVPTGNDDERVAMTISFARELRVWSRVDHPGVAPLLGFYLDRKAAVALFVTPFEPQGNLHEYLERTTLSAVQRLDIAIDTASGLLYLHTQEIPICHGDIKSLNVLITAEGQTKLCDFGLAKILEANPSGLTTAGFEEASTVKYMSWELACVEGARRSLRSDVWAWGGVSLEIFTGKMPYDQFRPIQIPIQLYKNVLPASLESLAITDRVRDLLRRCWEQDPIDRITMNGCYNILLEEKLSLTEMDHPEEPPSPPASPKPDDDTDTESDSDGPGSDEIKNSHTITLEAKPFVFGGYADMYRGSWIPAGRNERVQVALKVLRIAGMSRDQHVDYNSQRARVDKRLSREAYTWQKLHHPHITPILGFMRSENIIIQGDSPFLVSPYYSNGNILRYLSAHPKADKLQLMYHVADGLHYLHTLKPAPVAHLDIKGENILINDLHEASLCDFGVARVLDDIATGFTTSNPTINLQSASPELLDGEKGKTPSDVYAFAGVVLQVMSGQLPYYRKRKNMAHIAIAIATGQLPRREEHPIELPTVALDELWKLLIRCWALNPADRPVMGDVMMEIQRIQELVALG